MLHMQVPFYCEGNEFNYCSSGITAIGEIDELEICSMVGYGRIMESAQ